MFRFIHRWRCPHDYVETGMTERLVNEGASACLEPWVRLTCVDCGKHIERPEVLHRAEMSRRHHTVQEPRGDQPMPIPKQTRRRRERFAEELQHLYDHQLVTIRRTLDDDTLNGSDVLRRAQTDDTLVVNLLASMVHNLFETTTTLRRNYPDDALTQAFRDDHDAYRRDGLARKHDTLSRR